MKKYFGLLLILFIWTGSDILAQRRGSRSSSVSTKTYNENLYNALQWRSIGPFRGGRSAAVTGVPGKPNLFYFGATGGGVWKTNDGGNSYENISDGFFGGSIGAVTVSEWDNNVIYVGGGEVTVRGNVSYGFGMWKSMDAGKTWKHIGLDESRHIPRIRVHPRNPDLVYAAVLGDLFKPSDMRGVYRSKDGGATWQRILFANADAGAVDLVMDPNNPRILFASTWRVRRTPYSLESGGEGSALWKSTDGGDTWTNISANQGLPKGIWGISGVSVSPVNSERVYAIIENENGGVFRSNDGGETWTKTNDDRNLRQRAWYYTRIYADTQEEDKVVVLNVRYHVSKDGGRTFETSNAPHGDHHDLWIAPEDNQRWIMADDGGAQVSYDAGENWSTYMNQPTAQFYRVTTDDSFPYRIYGAQQDNSTVRIVHRNVDGGSIGEDEWESTAGGESGFIAIDPEDNDVVYGGSYGGLLTRINHRTGERRGINVWPDNPMGHGAKDLKYRFQWNYPIFFSPHDPNKLYCASNVLHVTTNDGQSWTDLSEDLTRNDPSTLGSSGGPITKDNTSVEYYATIFAAIESPYEKDLLWTGSDDGLVHVSRDGGKSWANVTPSGMPEWMMINSIEADPFVKGGAYIAGTRYKLGDYKPYLYRTKDYGQTWTLITSGIDASHFTRVVRADPKRAGLLYAGTEEGVYVSFDDGASWKSFQLNLPLVPVTDLALKDDNLIAATQGRSFWLIDDLTPLHQLSDAIAASNFHLYKPMPSYRVGGRGFFFGGGRAVGQNHPGGVMIHYYLKDKPDTTTVTLDISEMDGTLIQSYSSKARQRFERMDAEAGMNRFVWNMRYPNAERFDGMIVWAASTAGPVALPGTYKAKLTVGGQSMETEFQIVKDPRSSASDADLKAQFDFLMSVRDKLTETHTGITDLRKARGDINSTMKNVEDKDIKTKAKDILDRMKDIEEELYQTKNRSGQDPLNFPIRLNNKLGHLNSLMGIGDNPPTQGALQFQKEVTGEIDAQLEKLEVIFNTDIPELNKMLQEAGIDFIKIEKKQDTKTQ